jgi:hypothetical protein
MNENKLKLAVLYQCQIVLACIIPLNVQLAAIWGAGNRAQDLNIFCSRPIHEY